MSNYLLLFPGTPVGDTAECEAFATVFRERKKPLLVGSVKSNTGHTEICSGLTAIIKIVTAVLKGNLPPNLHLDNGNNLDTSLAGFNENILQVRNGRFGE